MKYIKFYNCEENAIIIEKGNYNDSIFKEQYAQALRLFNRMMGNLPYGSSNLIAFCGDRGEGKTSCLMTMRYILENKHKEEVKEIIGHYENIKPNETNNLELLPVIDPSFFDQSHNVLELVLGELYKRLQQYEEENQSGKSCEYSTNMYDRNELTKQFHKTKMCLRHLEKEKKELYDPLEELDALAAGINLKVYIKELFKNYLKYIHKEKLVISIDDFDLNMTGAYEMAEQIRKYLNNEYCILLISLKINQLTEAVCISIKNELEITDNSIDVNGMASKYITKLIPQGNRINMPKVSEICNIPLYLYNSRKDNKEQEKYHSVKEAVVQLIFTKTRYLFYNSKGSVSPIVPNNLRSLRQLLGMLTAMPDFENNQLHEENKKVFKAYFYQSWIQRFKSGNLNFIMKLIDNDNSIAINKIVVMYLNKQLKRIPNLTYDKLPDLFKEIMDSSNYIYNVSIGDVFVILDYLERSAVEEELKLLVFFLKSFYSIKMYEYYDIISEQPNELHPEDTEEGKSETTGEIYKSDAWFKRTNQMQRFVNGAYFCYEPNEILAPSAETKQSRDYKYINGKWLINNLTNIADRMRGYDSMKIREKKDFQKQFRLTEFFMLTISRSIEQKKTNNYSKIERIDSTPHHLKKFNSNMGYFVFDILSIFYNMLNIKYTYNRFNFNERTDLYDFALNHEWTLLHQMMEVAAENQYKDRKEDIDYLERKLISDSTIRNAEVLSSMMERIKSLRSTIRSSSINKELIGEFYNSIVNSDMKTYDRTEDDAYTIKFNFLNAIKQFLEECDEEQFDYIFVPGKEIKIPKKVTDEEVIELFDIFFTLYQTAITRKTILDRIEIYHSDIFNSLNINEWYSMFKESGKITKTEIIEALKPYYTYFIEALQKPATE